MAGAMVRWQHYIMHIRAAFAGVQDQKTFDDRRIDG